MIPKIIHYCWFGKENKNSFPYLENWKNKLGKEYKFIKWNEDNFDINEFRFTKSMYQKEKYAFVSDLARLYALYKQGGIYLDTDVELKRIPTEEELKKQFILYYEGDNPKVYPICTGFMGFEKGSEVIKGFYEKVYKDKVNTPWQPNSFLLKNYLINNNSSLLDKIKLKDDDFFIHHYMGRWSF